MRRASTAVCLTITLSPALAFAQGEEALRAAPNPLEDPQLDKVSIEGYRVVVLDAFGRDPIGRKPLTRALRKGIEAKTGGLVPIGDFTAAQRRLELLGRNQYEPASLARACREVQGQYVVVTQIFKQGWLYTAHTRLVNCENDEYQMDFRSQYYKPNEEAADRGQRIARITVAKMRLLNTQGLEPFAARRADKLQGKETATATIAQLERAPPEGPIGIEEPVTATVAGEEPEVEPELPSIEKPLTPLADLVPTKERAGIKPVFLSSFLLASETYRFTMVLALETRVQLSILDQKSVPGAPDPPSLLHIRPRSILLIAAGRVFQVFSYALIFGLTADPSRSQDILSVPVATVGMKIIPEFNFALGLISVPFGREATSYFFGSRTIERSITMDNLTPQRDAGASINGSIAGTTFTYSLAFITGLYGFAIDRRDRPDGVARFTFGLASLAEKIPWLAGLDIGASVQVGEQHFQPFVGATTYWNFRAQRDSLFVASYKGLRWRVGADLQYEYGPFGFQIEGAYERTQRRKMVTPQGELSDGGTLDASDIERFGGYAEVGMFVFGSREQGLEAVARYEMFWANGTGSDLGEAILNPLRLKMGTLGLNYYLRPTARIRLNGVLVDTRRAPLPERMEPPLFTYRDNRLSWNLLAELQFWFL